MAGMLMNYTFAGTNGDTYTGQVVADPTSTKYNYVAGQTYQTPDGSYKIDAATPPIPTNAPVGSVYQTSYTDGKTGTTYDSYHYDPKNNAYIDAKTQGYDKTTGMFSVPNSTPVPMWSTKQGLGEEYAYVKTADNMYHVYGGGGQAHAKITPDAIGLTTYDYRFTYPDGKTYYDGKVVDDGTYGYKPGRTIQEAGSTYSIYAVDPAKPAAGALAGQTYTSIYHNGDGKEYAAADIIPTSPYYNKPTGYGGLGSETDYIKKPGGYYAFDPRTSADTSMPVAAVPLPT